MRAVASVLAMSAWLIIGTPLAFADEVSDELAEMRTLVEQLKGQVEAQSEQISHQGEVIREARLQQSQESESRFGASGITAFLQRLVVEGHIAGSYFYNFNDPPHTRGVGGPAFTVGGNTGVSGNAYPFHGNHNSFQVDQVWFGLEHPVDEENRAGFRFDLVYGTTACTLGNAVPTRCGFGGLAFAGGNAFGPFLDDNTSQYYVAQAYIQYLAPITENGILIKAGRWATLTGAEVADTTANFNITRGNLYSLLQPIDHMGVLLSTDIGETGFSTSVGVMNDDHNGLLGSSDPDRNDAKSLVAQLAWAGDTMSAASTVLWGPSNPFSDNHSDGLLDLVFTWDPNEKISTWINFDYAWNNFQGTNGDAWGLAVAGRYAVTERLGVSTRAEVVKQSGGDPNNGGWGWFSTGPGNPFVSTAKVYSLTGTVDYALTTSLMVRGEVRYDNVTKSYHDYEFFDNGGDFRNSQTTAGVELVYEF